MQLLLSLHWLLRIDEDILRPEVCPGRAGRARCERRRDSPK